MATAGMLAAHEKGRMQRIRPGSGGARRDRTADLYNAIVALSQLSYGPVWFAAIGNDGCEGAN